jgi:hypothetical protein
MVSAILDGRKTQTRRPVKQKLDQDRAKNYHYYHINDWHVFRDNEIGKQEYEWGIKCPFGKPGDQLWVREKWGYFKDGQIIPTANVSPDGRNIAYWQRHKDYIAPTPEGKWKPSIHMPRWASRIMLEITNIKVERVQEISEQDAKNEGSPYKNSDISLNGGLTYQGSYKNGFEYLWDSIYKNWSANPWVWVVEFKVIEVN